MKEEGEGAIGLIWALSRRRETGGLPASNACSQTRSGHVSPFTTKNLIMPACRQ